MIKTRYEEDTLIEMAREVTNELKENEAIDWQYKESAGAKMRSSVKKLLKKI